MRIKKTIMLLAVAGCTLLTYWLWLSLRPVEIAAIHHRSSGFSDILVTNFPLTDKGKINWWLKNKDMLKAKYGVPKPDSDDYFYVTFWYFGEGYKEEGKYDRLCFEDMRPPFNCIDKDKAFTVNYSRRRGVNFIVRDGIYQLKENGDSIRIRWD